MKKIYVIAHTWESISLEIDHYFTPQKAVKALSDLISDDLGRKADPDDDPEEYYAEWQEWVREGNDNMTGEVDVTLKIIEI